MSEALPVARILLEASFKHSSMEGLYEHEARHLADALLASDWLVEHDRQVAEKARAEGFDVIRAALAHYEHERAEASDRMFPFGQEVMANAARGMANILRRAVEVPNVVDPEDDEEFCDRCLAGVDSNEHHEKCVVTGHAEDGESAPKPSRAGDPS